MPEPGRCGITGPCKGALALPAPARRPGPPGAADNDVGAPFITLQRGECGIHTAGTRREAVHDNPKQRTSRGSERAASGRRTSPSRREASSADVTLGESMTVTGAVPGGGCYRVRAGRQTRGRVEGVSSSLPNSDLLTLTSSHMFFLVMMYLPW